MVVMVDIGGTECNDVAMGMIAFVQHLSKDFNPRFS
jgi:glycerate kinase